MSRRDSTGVLEDFKGIIRMHGNTGEPTATMKIHGIRIDRKKNQSRLNR